MPALPILWWNETVVALNEGKPVSTNIPATGDPLLAFCQFVESLTPTPKEIRLIFQSSQIDHFITPCPKDSRAMIRRSLSSKFPALANSTTVWAAHKVRTNSSGTTTLLYIEQNPFLSKLSSVLEERGILLESAFPPLALVELAPPAMSDLPLVALIHTDHSAAVFRITADGDRHAVFFDGVNTMRERAHQELVTSLSVFEGTPRSPVFIVVNAGAIAFDLDNLAFKPTKIFAAHDFLANAALLKKTDTTNYLTSQISVNTDTITQAAAGALLLVAGLLAFQYYGDIRAAQKNRRAITEETAAMTEQVRSLQANQTRIALTNRVITDALPLPKRKIQLLEALNRARPATITIRSAAFNESMWTVTGTAHEGVGVENGPFQTFLAALRKSDGWEVATSPGTDAKGSLQQADFTLTGTFK